MSNDIWMTIPNTNEIYEASNLGKIKRVSGLVKNNINGGCRKVGGKELSQKTKSNGYKEVSLYISPMKSKMTYVHRAVYFAFNPDKDIALQVNHIDGDKSNNNISNLELCTPSKNVRHSYNVLLRKGIGMKGVNHHNSKLTNEDVINIREEHSIKRNVTELATKYNVGKSSIVRIISRESWSHI
jgi:hypothetical protein